MHPTPRLVGPQRYPWVVLSTFLLVALYTLLRDRYAYLVPVMAVEDGTRMFTYYTLYPSAQEILRFHPDYIALLPNMVGYLSARVRPTFAPYVLAWYPLILTATAYSVFSLRRFRVLVPNDWTRVAICFFLTVMPVGLSMLLSNTAYSLWNTLLLLILLLLAPVSTSRVSQGIQFVVMALAISSHPISLIVLPLCLYNVVAYKRPPDRILNGGLILVILAYQWLGVAIDSEQQSHLWGGMITSVRYLFNRVIVEATIGYLDRLALYTAGHLLLLYSLGGAILLGFLLLLYSLRHELTRTEWIATFWVWYFIIGITVLNAIGRLMDATSHMGAWNNRYFYIQQILFLLISAILVNKRLQCSPFKTPYKIAIAATLVIALLAVNYNSNQMFNTDRWAGERLAEFMQQIERALAEKDPGEVLKFRLGRDNFDFEVQY